LLIGTLVLLGRLFLDLQTFVNMRRRGNAYGNCSERP